MNPRLFNPLRERATLRLPRGIPISDYSNLVSICQPKAHIFCPSQLKPATTNVCSLYSVRGLRSCPGNVDWRFTVVAEGICGSISGSQPAVVAVVCDNSASAAKGTLGQRVDMSLPATNGEAQLANGQSHTDEPKSRIGTKSEGGGEDRIGDSSSLISNEEGQHDAGGGRSSVRAEGVGEKALEGEESVAKRMRTEEMPGNEVRDERERHIAAAWDHWRKLGEPKMHVAPMVDQSELPFRMLCRKYGATAAYTPMLHSRLFAQEPKYRAKEFTTCPEDRPLFVQFCANNPDTLLKAARLVESCCDYVDINLGCPQRIAKKGNYGAFLMDNLPLIKSLVSNLASNLTVPVSCKIRVFPNLEDTLAYARMLEEAGCSLLAVHGRTRDQKDGKLIRADWKAIQAVKKALRIPVLANGNIRWLEDVHACIASTGVDGVMSAESLLENPTLYSGSRMAHSVDELSSEGTSALSRHTEEDRRKKPQVQMVDERTVMLEYLELCEKYPVPLRMVRGHVHKILGKFWFKQHPDIREELNKQHTLSIEWLKGMVQRLMDRSPPKTLTLTGIQEPQLALFKPLLSHQDLPVAPTVIISNDVATVLSPSRDVAAV